MDNAYKSNYVNLYNARAHVFQIDPQTKNTWLGRGDSAIPISFVAALNQTNDTQPTSKRELKIIGTNENGDILLDSVILQKTQFTKRAQKFGQWTDHTGTVYGLGFNSEAELDEFVKTFQELKRNILSANNSTVGPQAQPVRVAATAAAAAAAAAPVGVANNQEEKASVRLVGGATSNASAWSKSQEQINNVSESNGRDFNNLSSTGADVSAHSGYSNTLAHPGHQQAQIRRQQAAHVAEYQNNNINNNSIISNTNNNGNNVATTNDNGINDNGASGARYLRGQVMYGHQAAKSISASSDGRATPETEGTSMSQGEWQLKEQVKQKAYENERLKQALEESSKNAVVWHNELANLRTNNDKLTQALQESKAHVEEWEEELLKLRDENRELKLRVMTLESANDSEKGNEYKLDLQKYKSYVEDIQSELRKKENEVEDLQRSMEQMEIKAASQQQNGQSSDAQAGKSINYNEQKQRLESINAKLDAKINELANVQKEFAQMLEKIDQQ